MSKQKKEKVARWFIEPRMRKNPNTNLFYVMRKEWYKEIKEGRKEVEFREYTPYHVDKCLGAGKDGFKTITFQLGYGGAGRSFPEQIVYEFKGVGLCDYRGAEYPAFNEDGTVKKIFPSDFRAKFITIHIGRRIK